MGLLPEMFDCQAYAINALAPEHSSLSKDDFSICGMQIGDYFKVLRAGGYIKPPRLQYTYCAKELGSYGTEEERRTLRRAIESQYNLPLNITEAIIFANLRDSTPPVLICLFTHNDTVDSVARTNTLQLNGGQIKFIELELTITPHLQAQEPHGVSGAGSVKPTAQPTPVKTVAERLSRGIELMKIAPGQDEEIKRMAPLVFEVQIDEDDTVEVSRAVLIALYEEHLGFRGRYEGEIAKYRQQLQRLDEEDKVKDAQYTRLLKLKRQAVTTVAHIIDALTRSPPSDQPAQEETQVRPEETKANTRPLPSDQPGQEEAQLRPEETKENMKPPPPDQPGQEEAQVRPEATKENYQVQIIGLEVEKVNTDKVDADKVDADKVDADKVDVVLVLKNLTVQPLKNVVCKCQETAFCTERFDLVPKQEISICIDLEYSYPSLSFCAWDDQGRPISEVYTADEAKLQSCIRVEIVKFVVDEYDDCLEVRNSTSLSLKDLRLYCQGVGYITTAFEVEPKSNPLVIVYLPEVLDPNSTLTFCVHNKQNQQISEEFTHTFAQSDPVLIDTYANEAQLFITLTNMSPQTVIGSLYNCESEQYLTEDIELLPNAPKTFGMVVDDDTQMTLQFISGEGVAGYGSFKR
jgi:hypothetical protein